MRCLMARPGSPAGVVHPAGSAAAILLVAALAGCGSVEPVAPYDAPLTDPAQLYMGLTLDHGAVTLDTLTGYNSWQLTATPRNALGEPLANLPAPTYRSTDTAAVQVSATGLLTARKAAPTVLVIAELVTQGDIRHADTAIVNVTTVTTPQQPASLTLISPSDSATWPITFFSRSGWGGLLLGPKTLAPTVLDISEAAIPALPVEYVSLDPKIATLTPSADGRTVVLNPIQPGVARLVARTTAYGTTVNTMVPFTVTLAGAGDVIIQPNSAGATVFFPAEVVIRPNGLVIWTTKVANEVDVTFDDPAHVAAPLDCTIVFAPILVTLGILDPGPHCGPGNVAVPPNPGPFTKTLRVRQFPEPGVYPYRTATGATGRVIVSDVAP